MKPLSSHWADIAATRIVHQRGEKDSYTVASGITPSGKVHVGNFREVVTVDLVARALKDLNKKVRFIYSWDNFDTFRKVPKNIPSPESFAQHLREPIARIPDPWDKSKTYAQGRIDEFEHELTQLGINPEYLYQESLYAKSEYAQNIRTALENKEKIRTILNEHRTTPLAKDWLPTVVYCSSCNKDEMDYQTYEGGWNYRYRCSNCSLEETIKINQTKNLKLIWRVDWPMRWHHEQVDFEPGGKDHSSQGGSFDTGRTIIKEIWNSIAPNYLQYDFVAIKGGSGKMSSSTGELLTLSDLLKVYEPQIIRWIFASHRPNHDFSIALDEDVIKIYEEFDKARELFSGKTIEQVASKRVTAYRALVFSQIQDQTHKNSTTTAMPSFRLLCNQLQFCNHDLKRTFKKYYKDNKKYNLNYAAFEQRAIRANHWIKHHAPESFKYTLRTKAIEITLSDKQQQAIAALKGLILEIDLEKIETKQLNQLIWERAIRLISCESNDAFQAFYQALIGRDQGPRLPGFLKEIGKEKVVELLDIK